MKIIDTHQHLWDLDLLPYSWTAQTPAYHRSFRLEDYAQATAGFAVSKTVHLECDVDEAFMLQETQHILRLAERDDNPLSGVVAGCRPEHTDFPAYLEQIVGHPQLKGLRRILHVVPDEVSLHPLFVPHVRSLAEYGLSFDICVLGRQLPLALRLVEQCPDVQFILDHCGNPPIATGDLTQWRADLIRLAALPNIVCKVSGVVTPAPTNWTVADLRPAVEHVIETFGWERVMFGSDWPVCTTQASFAQWVSALQEITAASGNENQDKLFRINAEQIYRL